MAKETKHVIIKDLSEYQKSLVVQAMAVTGNKTASRAILQVLSEYMDLRKQLFDLKQEAYSEPVKAKPLSVADNESTSTSVIELNEQTAETLQHIRDNAGITSDKLAELAGKRPRTISDRIKLLKENNLIRVQNDGSRRLYYSR